MSETTNGEPRYRVSRLSRRHWPFPRYGVMCGDGTRPLFVTRRFLRALLVRELLESACNDGGFIVQQRQLPEGMRHCTVKFVECEIGHGRLTATNWVDHGCPWCKIADGRAELEREQLRLAARGVAALGYFRGCAEEYRSASLDDVLQLRSETECLRALKGGAFPRSFVLELLGYLTGAIPELHKFETGRMAALLEEFERRSTPPSSSSS